MAKLKKILEEAKSIAQNAAIAIAKKKKADKEGKPVTYKDGPYEHTTANPDKDHRRLLRKHQASGNKRKADLYKRKLGMKVEKMNEQRPMPQDTPNEFAYLDFKKWAYKNRRSIKNILLKALEDNRGDGTYLFLALRDVWLAWANKKDKAWSNVPKGRTPAGKDFGRALAVMMKKDNLVIKRSGNKLTTVENKLKEAKRYKKGDKVKYNDMPGVITHVEDRMGKTYYSVKYKGPSGTRKARMVLSTDGSITEAKVSYNFSEEELIRVIKQLKRNASGEVDMIKAFEKALGRKLTRDELFELKELDARKIKTIDIWFEDSRGMFYRTVVNGKKRVPGWDSWSKAGDSLSKLLGYEINLRRMNDRELEKAAKNLKSKGIKLTWDDAMDVS